MSPNSLRERVDNRSESGRKSLLPLFEVDFRIEERVVRVGDHEAKQHSAIKIALEAKPCVATRRSFDKVVRRAQHSDDQRVVATIIATINARRRRARMRTAIPSLKRRIVIDKPMQVY